MSLQQILFYGIIVFIAFITTLSDDEVSGKISWIVGAVVAVVIGYSSPSISSSWWGLWIGPILLVIGAGLSRVVLTLLVAVRGTFTANLTPSPMY